MILCQILTLWQIDDTFSTEDNRAVLTVTFNYIEISTRFEIC